MMECKVDCKKLVKLSLIAFVSLWVMDFIIHGKILESMYMETVSLWRPKETMGPMMPFMIGGQFLFAMFFTWIFLHGYKGTGISEGVRYGLLMGGLQAGYNLIMYSVQPFPLNLTIAWIVLGAIECVICGVILAKFAK